MTQRRIVFAAGLGLMFLVAACQDDVLNSPGVPPYAGGAMAVHVFVLKS